MGSGARGCSAPRFALPRRRCSGAFRRDGADITACGPKSPPRLREEAEPPRSSARGCAKAALTAERVLFS